MTDWTAIHREFPAAGRVAYLDASATGLMPRVAQEALAAYHAGIPFNAGVRLSPTVFYGGIGEEADAVTARVADARETVARALHTAPADIAFTKNGTEGMTAVADGLPWQAGDQVLISEVEHQSGALPWVRLAEERGVELVWIPADGAGRVDARDVEQRIGSRTRAIVLIHVSSLFGTIEPVEPVGALARARGLTFVVDAAQSAGRIPVDVARIGCDFLVASGRKGLLGPQGIGVLAGRDGSLRRLRPLTVGSRSAVFRDDGRVSYAVADSPFHLEAGAVNASGAIGLGASVGFLESLGWPAFFSRIESLGTRLWDAVAKIPGVTAYGDEEHVRRTGILSFNAVDHLSRDVCEDLWRREQVIVSPGIHGSPLALRKIGVAGTARASVHCWTTEADIDRLARGLRAMTASRATSG